MVPGVLQFVAVVAVWCFLLHGVRQRLHPRSCFCVCMCVCLIALAYLQGGFGPMANNDGALQPRRVK